jgi:maleate cis-trans isomerase
MFRVGLLVPSSNTVMEPEFYRMAPQGVSVHSARIKLTEFTHDALMKSLDGVQREAELLSSARVDVMVYGCSTCAIIGGVDWEQVLVDQIKFNTGVRVVTVNLAMVEAIRALGGGRVGVVTPYTETLNRLKRRYLEAHGLTVSSISGLGLSDALRIGAVEEESIMPLVEKAASDADVILIGCSSISVVHLIDRVESKTGVPVVTSNQAGFWAALRGSGIGAVDGYGRLMRLP